jgi:SAM-dependent methyltransferase
VSRTHGRLVHRRRVRVLAGLIAPLVEPGWRVADIGCGDGTLADLLRRHRSPLIVEGFETSVRPRTAIPVQAFDGVRIPLESGSVDAALLIDVLHHTRDPVTLLAEAVRVARCVVIVKDHRLARLGAAPLLRLMDWVGNRGHGIGPPFNYWSEAQWRATWQLLGVGVDHYQTRLGLYPWPASWLFESGLHFLARLIPEHGR